MIGVGIMGTLVSIAAGNFLTTAASILLAVVGAYSMNLQ
jgi:hypothetical protein